MRIQPKNLQRTEAPRRIGEKLYLRLDYPLGASESNHGAKSSYLGISSMFSILESGLNLGNY